MTSPEQIAAMIARLATPRPRVGFVRAVTGSSVTVQMDDGATTTGLGWLSSGYSPVVGDRVLAVPAASGEWFVVGKVTSSPATALAYKTRTLERPTNAWWKQDIERDTARWSYQWDQATASYEIALFQGRQPEQAGSSGQTQPNMTRNATLLHWGTLASLVPSGSTIAKVALRIDRPVISGGPPLVSPVLYGHTYTPGAQPVVGTAPSFAPGFGPLRLGTLARGQSGAFILPSAWVTAWLAGTLTGIGVYSPDVEDNSTFRGPGSPGLEITYL